MSNVAKDVGKMASRWFKPGYQGQEESKSWADIAPISSQEQAYLDQFQQLGNDVASQGVGPMELAGKDRALLDQIYKSSQDQLMAQARDLSATRGLNASDTPIMSAYLPAAQSLLSSKAEQELGLGLNMRDQKMKQMMASGTFMTDLADRARQERYARAVQHGTGMSSGSNNPNGMQNAMQMLSAVGTAASMFGGGLSTIGGMAGAAGAGMGLSGMNSGGGQPSGGGSISSFNLGPRQPFGNSYWMNYGK